MLGYVVAGIDLPPRSPLREAPLPLALLPLVLLALLPLAPFLWRLASAWASSHVMTEPSYQRTYCPESVGHSETQTIGLRRPYWRHPKYTYGLWRRSM